MEGHVHVGGRVVERGVDRSAVRLEGETGRHGLVIACGVVVGRVGGTHEVRAGLKRGVIGEGRGIPNSKADWVAEPAVLDFQRVAD